MPIVSHGKAILITCCVALLWSLAGFNIKMIDWSSYAIAGGRSIVAVCILTPLVWGSANRKIDIYVLGGAVCYAAFNYCFIASTKLTTSATAITMQYTAPVYVALLSWIFLRERITKSDIINIIFVLIGMLLVFTDSTRSGNMIGNIIAVFNGITFAGVAIFLRKQKEGNPVMSMYLGNAFSGIIGVPFIIKSGIPDLPSILFLLLAGTLMGLTYMMYAKASMSLSAFETVLLPILDPVMNPVWVYLILHEIPGMMTILGNVVILISVTAHIMYGFIIGHSNNERSI